MLALLFRHGVELTTPGPTSVFLEDAGDGALAQIPPQGVRGAACTCPRSWPGTSQLIPSSRSASWSEMLSRVSGQLWG